MSTSAFVNMWGVQIGAVTLEDDSPIAAFEYTPEFAASGIEVSPLTMPLRQGAYRFPTLDLASFHGLPGLLADSLPDTFGNALIDEWLARQGRRSGDFNAAERLCYTGIRGMGALEFAPARGPEPAAAGDLQVDALVKLASLILAHREGFATALTGDVHEAVLLDILRVGTSAGGARAKAVIAFNPTTGAIRSGQVAAGEGFEYWLLKFDGVQGNRDRELNDPEGYGAIEYAYALMAGEAGIDMAECRLLQEGGRRHFMTRRFDRLPDGGKLHMQSLAALGPYDYRLAGSYSYEQALQVIRELGLGADVAEQQFRRMAFNVVARNQDDHVKNIAFLMDREARWSLAPAFDVTYAYNPNGSWTGQHQMSLNGKRDAFTVEDFRACAKLASLKGRSTERILGEVHDAVSQWPRFAQAAAVDEHQTEQIARAHRLDLAPLQRGAR